MDRRRHLVPIRLTCDANVRVETCDATFDTKLAVYPDGPIIRSSEEVLVCKDDECGDPNFPLQAELTFPAKRGDAYLIQLGGYRAETGIGTLKLAYESPSSATLPDFATLSRCFTGSCSLDACEPPIYDGKCCESADFDADGDVDLEDYELLVAVLVGP